MATWLGLASASVQLADPSQCGIANMKVGAYRRMASGDLKADFVQNANKMAWDVQWELLSGTNRNAVRAEAIRTGSMVWSPPEASGSFNVLARDYQERLIPSGGGTIRWNLRLRLEQL